MSTSSYLREPGITGVDERDVMSVRRRFIITFLANGVRAGASFVLSMIVARYLGVADYGNFQFLTATALAWRQFIDLGTSSAFFTLVSRGDRRGRVLATYFAWLVLQLLLLLLVLAIALPRELQGRIWLGQRETFVALAILSAFATDALWTTVVNIGESLRKTEIVQIAGLGAVLVYGAGLGLLIRAEALSIGALLGMNAAVYGLVSCAILWRLSGGLRPDPGAPSHNLWRYYADYCFPLMCWAPIAFLHNFADTWMLQHLAGARAQGLFGVSQQISIVSILATTSFVKVFHKEVSEAVSRNRPENARALLDKASRYLYLAGAGVSAFFIPLSGHVVATALGPEYVDASLPVAVMLLYPVHQALGQLNGTFFQATAAMKTYVRLNAPLMLLGLPVTYFFLAPPDASVPGLALGSLGVPLKMVLLQLVTANANALLIHRRYGWSYNWGFQATTLASLLAISACSSWIAGTTLDFLHPGARAPEIIAASACLYVVIAAVALKRFPTAFGIREDEAGRFSLNAVLSAVRTRI